MGYAFLNVFFFVFHTAWTLFNITGWAFRRTRRLHLATMLLTAGSWFVLGIWYGLGYCACTDWHWQVRAKMGLHDESRSYIHFLLLKITGINFDRGLVEGATLAFFVLSFALSIVLNVRDAQRRKRSAAAATG
ncbi:DUF2784 domain-containing protein [Flaviaesturariibacter amylovorans]|uniref:DUF2784 family protein n=1 Tax=Flaviaesturariibacter amylovorans TaxID=1084520 RepID=A0ABP8HF39_9BACT